MKAYELLDNKDKWTQLAYARNKDNKACDVDDVDAVRFCLVGAIVRCYSNCNYINKEYSIVQTYLQDVEKTGEYPHSWNDRHTYEEVITLLKRLDI